MQDAGIDAQLRFAIANQRLLQLGYRGALRVVEPHDYGVLKGQVRLLVFQLRGPSSAGRSTVRGWRLLDVAKIDGCTVLKERFGGGRGHEHSIHNEWDVVFARVARSDQPPLGVPRSRTEPARWRAGPRKY